MDLETLKKRCLPFEHTAEKYTEKLPYRLMNPENRDGKKRPLIVYMHGMGSVGTDNLQQIHVSPSVGLLLDYMDVFQPQAVLLAPQTAYAWVDTDWTRKSHTMKKDPTQSFALLLDLIQTMIKDPALKLDPGRIYLTGNSMGGFCSWEMLQRTVKKNIFAGALIICGGADKKVDTGSVPVWCTHGDADDAVLISRSREMVKARKGRNIILTEYPGCGHNVWEATYSNRAYLDWLFAQRRKK